MKLPYLILIVLVSCTLVFLLIYRTIPSVYVGKLSDGTPYRLEILNDGTVNFRHHYPGTETQFIIHDNGDGIVGNSSKDSYAFRSDGSWDQRQFADLHIRYSERWREDTRDRFAQATDMLAVALTDQGITSTRVVKPSSD